MTEKVVDLLEELDFNPVRELVTLYRDPETDRRTKVRIASELAQFVAPKLKAIDVQAADNPGIIVQLIHRPALTKIIVLDEKSPPNFRRQAALPMEH